MISIHYITIVSKVKIDVLIVVLHFQFRSAPCFTHGLWGGIQYTKFNMPRTIILLSSWFQKLPVRHWSHEKRNEITGLLCFAMLLLLFLFSILHLRDMETLGFETPRNRINPDIMGSPFTSYSSVKRYQSFFGDPNKFALCVALLNFFIFSSLRARKLYLPTGNFLWIFILQNPGRLYLVFYVVIVSFPVEA